MVCLVANATDYYLMGVGGWNWKFDGSSEANQHKFQSNGDGTFSYTYTGTIPANTGFQIAAVDNGSSSKQFRSNGSNVVLDQPYTMVFGAGENMSITQDVTNPTFTIKPDSKILTVSTGGQIITPTPGEISWYLKSAAWNNWNDKKNFTLQSDGTYLLENVDITAGSEFKAFMTTNNKNEKGYKYGNNDSHYSFDAPKDEMLYEKGFNMKLNTAGKYSFTISQEGSNWKMKTVKAGNAPEHVYVIGSIKDNKWNTKSAPEMTKNGSKFTLSNVELVNDGDKAKFTLITKLGDDWPAVNGSNRFGPRSESESDTDASTTAANMVKEYKVGTDNVGSATNWLIAAGTYDLVFDYDALTLTITESGVTPPTPGEGIYVRVKNEAGWKSVNIHYWENDAHGNLISGHTTAWPGKPMEKKGDYFEYTIKESWTPTNFILSENGSNQVGSTAAPVNGKIYTNKANPIEEYKETPAPKGNWYIWGADEKSLGKWNENQMREFMRQEDGTYKLSVYLKNSSDFQVRFKAENSNSYSNYKYENNGGANAELKDKDDQELFRVDQSMYTKTEGAYTLKIYFKDSKWHMTADLECQSTGDLYLLGDINNWMNDGTYKVESQNYNYDYSKAVNGTRAQYQFVKCPDVGLISGNFKGSEGWYVLDLAKTTTGGNIWGQFTIVRDKGLFVAAKKAENRTDGRDVINWDKGFDQWQHEFDRLNNGSPNQDYLDEDIEAFTIAESSSVGVYDKDSNRTGKIYKSKGGGANFHLAHNMYTNAKVLFNVNNGEVCIYSDDKPTDFYIYLSTDADRNDNDPADKYVGIIKQSMNSVNYTVNFKDFAVDSQTGTAMTLCQDEQQFPNGLVYTKYWKIKIPNGIEGPAGQKFNVNIKGSKGYRDSKYSTIFLNDLYIIDGLKAFAKAEDQKVESVQYRLYGYPADGDVNNLVIIDAKTGDEKPAFEADGEYGWVTLKQGEYSYHPYSTSWWHTGKDESIIGADFTTKTHGFYPDFKEGSTNEYYSIPAEHAMKFIQWRIIYKDSQNVQGMRKAAGEKRLVPETLTVDRSNPNADWVLNGTHKEIMAGVATGVEDIEMEDGEISEEGEAVAPVYYNLQGVRVAEPQHGLYIKVTGNKSEKILVK